MRAPDLPVPVLEQAQAEGGRRRGRTGVKNKLNPLKDPEGGVLRVARLMDAIVQCFKPGTELTLVIRNRSFGDDADAVLGNDRDVRGTLKCALAQVTKKEQGF